VWDYVNTLYAAATTYHTFQLHVVVVSYIEQVLADLSIYFPLRAISFDKNDRDSPS
jgi:adenylate cyclase